MEQIKVVSGFVACMFILMIIGAYLASREKKRKEDKKKVVDFQKLLRTQLVNSGWRKNPGKDPEDTAKKIIEYLKSHHIDTEFNALLRDITNYPHNNYRPLTDLQTMEILEDSHILLEDMYIQYQKTHRQSQNLREQEIDKLQKEFFNRMELIILDKIDPNPC